MALDFYVEYQNRERVEHINVLVDIYYQVLSEPLMPGFSSPVFCLKCNKATLGELMPSSVALEKGPKQVRAELIQLLVCALNDTSQILERYPIDGFEQAFEVLQVFVRERTSLPRCIYCESTRIIRLEYRKSLYIPETSDTLILLSDGLLHGMSTRYILDGDGHPLKEGDWHGSVIPNDRVRSVFRCFFTEGLYPAV